MSTKRQQASISSNHDQKEAATFSASIDLDS